MPKAAAKPTMPVPSQTSGGVEFALANGKTVIIAALQGLNAAVPLIESGIASAKSLAKKLEPYHPQALTSLLQFPITLAAIEAFRICGWDSTQRALHLLYQQYTQAMEASRKDDLVDANKDGIPDVLQADTHALATRKLAVFLKATNPVALNDGLQGLTAGFTAVLCSLRLHFAQTITLGISLGDMFTKAADHLLRPALEKMTPPEYHKWLGLGISYCCRSVAVTLAWWCQRIISTLHSSMRGAQLLLAGISSMTKRLHVKMPVDLSPSNEAYPVLCSTISGVGLYSQLVRGFLLPFPLNILLLPLRLVEGLLWLLVAYGPK
ncbi:hypothetical protein QJQ45_002067 [Haematococcus lacustris]|nr:hypothetical protein QJQ45_002067 [Haematococcus lacustris]